MTFSFQGNWIPANSSSCQAGNMVCCSCNKPIKTNSYFQYRVRTKGDDWKYQCQHQECASNKDDWGKYFKILKQEADLDSRIKKIIDSAGLDIQRDTYSAEEVIYQLIAKGLMK